MISPAGLVNMNGGKVLFYGIIALVVSVALIDAGYVLLYGLPASQSPNRLAVPQVSETPAPASVITLAETPAEHSIYMYSTARGYRYHDAGFVCTDKSGTSYLYGPEGLIGIICEY